MRRALLSGLGSVVVGVLFGRGMSQIPSPHDAHVFWVGNLCAPWLVLAFLAGRVQRRRRWAALAGVATDVACVAGFYSEFLFLPLDSMGLSPGTPVRVAVTTDVERWLTFIAPWLGAAVLGGLVYGLLGWWWRTARPLAAAVALGLPFVAEPALWPLEDGFYRGPWPLWAVEVAVGLAVVGLMAAARRRPSRTALAGPR